jgi:hypothetical protein
MPSASEQFKNELKKAAARLKDGKVYADKARSVVAGLKDTPVGASAAKGQVALQMYDQARHKLLDAADRVQFEIAYKEWAAKVADLAKAQKQLASDYAKVPRNSPAWKKVKASILPKSIDFSDVDADVKMIKAMAAKFMSKVPTAKPADAAGAPPRPSTPAPTGGAPRRPSGPAPASAPRN